MLAAALLLIVLQGTIPADTLRLPRAQAEAEGAYLDAGARELLRLARAAREEMNRSLTAYRVVGRERLSVGIRALRRDRTLFRRETAARIHWRREGVGRVEVLGARQVVPVVQGEPEVDDAGDNARDLAFDPADNQILSGFTDPGSEHDHGDTFFHPLAEGSERLYRFQSGDTTRLRLPGGREVRLAELRVLPRPGTPPLLQGSLWFDLDSYAPVRGVFRLSRRVDLERDLGEGDEDVPGVLKPIEAELRLLTVDYGLWEQRWWLPRLIAVDAEARLGSMARVPVRYERAYGVYQVEGEGTEPLATDRPPGDSAKVARTCNRGRCWSYVLQVPADSVLLHSEHLPPSLYSGNAELVSRREMEELAELLGVSGGVAPPWRRPVVRWAGPRQGLVRYNRVEGLVVGARADADFGPMGADATLWLPTAAWEPAGELAIRHERFGSAYRLAAYRRLAAVEPAGRGPGLGSSLSALLLGRDDHDYHRTLGVELTGASTGSHGWDYRWRVYAERQRTADKSTDFSLPRLWDGGRSFPDNILAGGADQVGSSVSLGWARGANPVGFRWGGRAGAGAEAGTYRFVRPSASLFTTFPLPAGLVAALEVAGGTTVGESPLQSEWFLGGPATVRGYGGGSRIHGPAYWRGRAEVATSLPAARLVLFSDAAWAGLPAEMELAPILLSAGAGVSLLDGLVRADLSRALRGSRGWRVDVYLDALF